MARSSHFRMGTRVRAVAEATLKSLGHPSELRRLACVRPRSDKHHGPFRVSQAPAESLFVSWRIMSACLRASCAAVANCSASEGPRWPQDCGHDLFVNARTSNRAAALVTSATGAGCPEPSATALRGSRRVAPVDLRHSRAPIEVDRKDGR